MASTGSFGSRIKERRLALNMTQTELIELANAQGQAISQPFLSQIESDNFTEIGFMKLYVIARILGVDIYYLIKGE